MKWCVIVSITGGLGMSWVPQLCWVGRAALRVRVAVGGVRLLVLSAEVLRSGLRMPAPEGRAYHITHQLSNETITPTLKMASIWP